MRRKLFSLFLLTVLSLAAGPFASSPSPVSASNAFNCQPGFYQVISGQLNILNPLTGVYSPIGAQGDTYNAIGFNPVDNFIYGWGTSGAINGQVIKVAVDGSITPMGNAGLTGTSYVSADFDDEGFLWMRKNSTVLTKVDVRQNPATATEITFTGSSLVGVDLGWINDSLYSVNDSTLMKADLNALTVTHATITDLNSPAGKEFPASGSYGAVFSNRADELYVSNNGLGRIYRITDFNTANPRATWVVDATVTSNNDGAACKLAPSPFDSPTAADDTYSTTNDVALTVTLNDGVFDNDGSSSPTVISHSNPSSGTLTLNADGSFTYTPAQGFVGAVTFTYIGQDQWGRTMPSATVTINVTRPAGSSDQQVLDEPADVEDELPNAGNSGLNLLVVAILVSGGMGLLSVRRRLGTAAHR